VRAVGVHLDHDVVALGDGPAEAGEVGGAQAVLAVRCRTLICASAAASSSASRPVPSGLLSSTTRTSASGVAARTRPTISGRFSRSLYVGMITTMRPSVLHGQVPLLPPGANRRHYRGHAQEDRAHSGIAPT